MKKNTRHLLDAVVALLILAAVSTAQTELRIDNVAEGSGAILQLGFEVGETGAVVLPASPADPVTLQELRVYIDKYQLILGSPETMEARFHVWDNATLVGGVLSPGAAVYTSPVLLLAAASFNTHDVSTQNLVMNAPFVVGVEIVTTGNILGLTTPSLVTDSDGCTGGLNWARLTSGLWIDTCAFGFSGDLSIRAVVDDGDTSFVDLGASLAGSYSPELNGSGSLAAGASFDLTFEGLPPFTALWLFVGAARFDAPFFGGVLVPDPTLTVLLSTGTGTLVLNASMPAGLPPGVSIYLHGWTPDAGGPFGASATNALELITP